MSIIIFTISNVSIFAHVDILNVDYDDCVVPMDSSGIKYEDGDTTRYNIVITDDKIYVAYSDNLYQHLSDEIFKPSEYHLIGVRNAYVGFDSSHEWTIQLKKPYTQYVDRFNDGNWKREETSNILSFIKETYSDGCKQSEERIDFNKKRNVAIISYGSF